MINVERVGGMIVDASGRVIDAAETTFDLTPIVHLLVCLSTSQLL